MPRKNPDYTLDTSRLVRAIQISRRVLTGFQQERRNAVKQYAGSRWGGVQTENDPKQPLNLLSLYVRGMSRKLVSRAPRVMLSTFQQANKPAVAKMQAWMNTQMERMGIVETLQRQTVDGLFCMGVVKVGLADPGLAAMQGFRAKAGAAFAQVIDLDDWCFDHAAHDFREAGFMGHRIRIPLAVAREFSAFDPKVRKRLTPGYHREFTEYGAERVDALGPGSYGTTGQEIEDYVDLWEIWLARHRQVLTLVADASGAPVEGSEPLRVQRWLGPDGGPYHFLAFDKVPGNIMPKAPVMDLMDMDWAANESYRKLLRQTGRAKEVGLVRRAMEPDGTRIVKANDGDMIGVDDPDGAKVMTFGGVMQSVMGAAMHFKEVFSYLAGNMDLWGGQSPQSKTVGQDKLLAEAAGGMLADLQAASLLNTQAVCTALAWYYWHDPRQTYSYTEQIPGLPDVTMPRTLTPEERQKTDWADLQLTVNPYSVQPKTPQGQAAQLDQMLTQVVIPMMPLLQQQGVEFNVQKYLKIKAEYMDLPELAEIVTIGPAASLEGPMGGPDKDQGDGQGESPRYGRPPRMAPQTERTYNRVSTSRETPAARQQAMMSLMGGNGPQRNGQVK